MCALGLIEVKGFLAAVVAADHGLKSAHVKLMNVEKIRGGYVTVQFTGDISAIKAAVESSVEAVKRLDINVQSHIIAKVHEETNKLLISKHQTKEAKQLNNDASEKSIITVTKKDKSNTNTLQRDELEKLTVNELRKRIRKNNMINVDSKIINFARKEALINMLLNNGRKDDSDVD